MSRAIWDQEAGCFREVAALHSDHLRQVPLYVKFPTPDQALCTSVGHFSYH